MCALRGDGPDGGRRPGAGLGGVVPGEGAGRGKMGAGQGGRAGGRRLGGSGGDGRANDGVVGPGLGRRVGDRVAVERRELAEADVVGPARQRLGRAERDAGGEAQACPLYPSDAADQLPPFVS